MTHQVTLEQTAEAMAELICVDKTPCEILAWYASCLSIQTDLETNGIRAQVMRQYADKPLPVNRAVLNKQLGGIFKSTLDTLYRIEELSRAGILHFNCGYTYESQSAWRRSMVSAIKGLGMKCVSFALTIYASETCQLLTIDRWHIARFQDGARSRSVNAKQYIELEQQLFGACELLAYEEGQGKEYSPLVLSACLWERIRQELSSGVWTVSKGTYSSHAKLSCYV